MQNDYFGVLKVRLLVVAVVIIPILIWYLFGVVLMVFGAVILTIVLRLVAQPFIRGLSFPEAAAGDYLNAGKTFPANLFQ
jgi:ABC-type bacteriocin/lantibiotic exporter with double-glycine peptidase domain